MLIPQELQLSRIKVYIDCFKKITVRNDCQAIDFIKFAFAVYLKQKGL